MKRDATLVPARTLIKLRLMECELRRPELVTAIGQAYIASEAGKSIRLASDGSGRWLVYATYIDNEAEIARLRRELEETT